MIYLLKYLTLYFKVLLLSTKDIRMETPTFRIVTTIDMGLTLTVAALSLIGITLTGLYPGIIVLCLLPLVPIASRYFAKQRGSKADGPQQRNYLNTLTVLNLVAIFVVLWMTFVITVERVLSKVL